MAVAVGLIGYIVGSLVIGALADRYRRYRMPILTIVLTAVGSFGDAGAQGLGMLIAFRFVTGVGVGADLNLVSTYVGELAPPARRVRISLITFLVGIIGQAVTPFVALALVPHYAIGWRMLFVIGGVIAVIGLAMRFELPSPRAGRSSTAGPTTPNARWNAWNAVAAAAAWTCPGPVRHPCHRSAVSPSGSCSMPRTQSPRGVHPHVVPVVHRQLRLPRRRRRGDHRARGRRSAARSCTSPSGRPATPSGRC